MSEIFKRLSNEISDNAIKGMVEEEISSADSEEAVLPLIKLKPTKQEQTVKIPEKKEKKPEREPIFKVDDAGDLLKGTGENTVKLPGSLTYTQKLRKSFRFRRFGEPRTPGQYKREQLPLPELKEKEKKKLVLYRLKKKFFGMELLLPAVLLFFLFSWMPIFKTFAISLQEYININEAVYVGFENFRAIAADREFWSAFKNSAVLSLIVIVFGVWIPFFLALYVFEMRKMSFWVKMMYFIPFLTPAVPAAILWKWMYNQGFGLINGVLSLFTAEPVTIGWLTNPKLVLVSIAVVFIWKNTGWAMLIYMAAMQNIPKVLFEDAAILGAGVGRKIRTIVLPALFPVMLAVVFIQIINGMQVFTEVYIMTNGGPAGSSEVIATYIYKKAFLYMDIGYASGVAVFFLFILISITMSKMAVSRIHAGVEEKKRKKEMLKRENKKEVILE